MTIFPQTRGNGGFTSKMEKLAGALEPLAAQGQARANEELMRETFAINPEFAQQLYGTIDSQNRTGIYADRARAEKLQLQDRQRKNEQLAGLIRTGNFNPEAAAAIDPERFGGALIKSRIGTSDPASVRTAEWYANASPEERENFDRVNKVGLERVDRGDKILLLDKVTGQVVGEIPKELAPNELPETKKQQQDAVNESDNYWKPKTAEEVAAANAVGKDAGESQAEYNELVAAYPQLMETTSRLKNLAQVATYSGTGRFTDSVKRQLGINVGDAAEAAAEMANIVNVEILPQLKPTFGAAFTVTEGEWLKSTMGDPNLSPQEKIRQIDARIRGWDGRIKTLETKLNVPEGERLKPQESPKTMKWNDLP